MESDHLNGGIPGSHMFVTSDRFFSKKQKSLVEGETVQTAGKRLSTGAISDRRVAANVSGQQIEDRKVTMDGRAKFRYRGRGDSW